jgi:hypothetical protein
MSIGFLIQPEATWKPYVHPVPKSSPKPRPWQEPDLRWADLADEQRWGEAIIAYLKVNWRGQHLMWRVINAVAAESRPETRSLIRSVTQDVLAAMMDLIRARRVMRYRRRWVAALELPT